MDLSRYNLAQEKPVPKACYAAWISRNTDPNSLEDTEKQARVIVDSLEKSEWFHHEYEDCVRAALSLAKNNPPTQAKKNRILKQISALKRDGLAAKRAKNSHEMIRYHIELTRELTGCTVKEACERIMDETTVRTRTHFFHIESRLAWAFCNAGGRVAISDDGAFKKVLWQFRRDCRKYLQSAAPYEGSIGHTHIGNLLAAVRKSIAIPEHEEHHSVEYILFECFMEGRARMMGRNIEVWQSRLHELNPDSVMTKPVVLIDGQETELQVAGRTPEILARLTWTLKPGHPEPLLGLTYSEAENLNVPFVFFGEANGPIEIVPGAQVHR